tara:strand:- start:478 stop:627 length:150 start_codon:yes stop_codon:yes gene_type:complete
MTNNEDSVKIEDAEGNLAYEVIDVIKAPTKLYSDVKKEPRSDWRNELDV